MKRTIRIIKLSEADNTFETFRGTVRNDGKVIYDRENKEAHVAAYGGMTWTHLNNTVTIFKMGPIHLRFKVPKRALFLRAGDIRPLMVTKKGFVPVEMDSRVIYEALRSEIALKRVKKPQDIRMTIIIILALLLFVAVAL